MTLLIDMYDILKAAGLPVVVGNPQWATAGRPYPFEFRGSIAHHTASPANSSAAANRSVCINGNSVAPGPISNLLLQRDCTVELIAAGRCNHAGIGEWPLGKNTGNTYGFAMENCNDGRGEYWKTEFVEIMARTYVAMHEAYGIPLELSWTHHAYAGGRKIDPAGPALFRHNRPGTWTNQEWQDLLRHHATPPAPPIKKDTGEENMIDAIYYPVAAPDGKKWWSDDTPHLLIEGTSVRRAVNADYDLRTALVKMGSPRQFPTIGQNSQEQYNYLIGLIPKEDES